MFKPKYRFTHEEIRIIVMALVELKNSLISIKQLRRWLTILKFQGSLHISMWEVSVNYYLTCKYGQG